MTIIEEIQSIKQRFGIIGNAAPLNHAVQVAIQVAPTDMTVLITGESGSGKESFSKIIHSLSVRKHGQFIAINCGAIPEGTIDSELFGHEKGSFTGAHESRKGYFEVTNGGTIFLDEIGEMPLGTQARLLRVLENGEFIKVGASKTLKTDVRVVAATNVNLYDAVQKGRFREDLYYRLNTVPIYVPPLRERGNDIDLLFKKFAGDFSEKYRVPPIKLNEEAKAQVMRFAFPGNIRQLKNLVEQISVLSVTREINKEILSQYLPDHSRSTPMLLKDRHGHKEDLSERDILYKILFDMKRDMNELKKMVLEVAQNAGGANKFVQENADMFEELSKEMNGENKFSPFLFKPSEPKQIEIEKIEDVTHEPEEESLSIETKEKELILKALKKNKNKRKYAAQDLGISERTLYRKIKEYAIEE